MSATTSYTCALPGADSVTPVPIAIEHADCQSDTTLRGRRGVRSADRHWRSGSTALAKPVWQTTARWRILTAIEHESATVAHVARA
jgi:hypothetical protein